MISVIICTYRRPQYLRRTLEHLAKMPVTGLVWEVVVVDNAGCGETQRTVDDFSGRFSSIRCVVESNAGVAFARNRGWREAAGDIVAYLDDDCLVNPGWLAQIEAFFSTGPGKEKSTGLVGGRILLRFEMERPVWLSDALLPYLSQIDWGDQIELLKDATKWIGEGNLAVRRIVLDEAGGFPEALGRRKGSLLGHEGNAVRDELEKLGYVTWYNGGQQVEHLVFEERVASKRWLRKRAFWGGVSEAICHVRSGIVARKGKRRLAASYARLVCSFGTLRRLIGRQAETKQLEEQCDALFKLGYAVGLAFRS